MRNIIVFLILAILSGSNANAQADTLAKAKTDTLTVTLKQIGQETIMFSSRIIDCSKHNLYAVENTGALYKTDLITGSKTRLGNVVYKYTRFLFVVNNQLYCIETDGSMNRIDIYTGAWTVVSPIGTWNHINRVVVVGNNFYTTQNSALYRHPYMTERVKIKIGDDEFRDLGYYFRTDSTLHTLFADGTLYNIDMPTGKWKRIGPKKGWKFAYDGAVIGHKFYSFEIPSSLFETDLTTGVKKQLDDKQFKNTLLMFSDSGKLYAIFKGGILYEIVIN